MNYSDEIPAICGQEEKIDTLIKESWEAGPVYKDSSKINFSKIRSACAVALHMHQPMIPAGNNQPLSEAKIISNLEHMMQNPGTGDNHNATVFHDCYKRMGRFIPQLVKEGFEPRVMLDYSGILFHGLKQMGLHDVFDDLATIAKNPEYSRCVEWLATPWGHAVAPSTPVQDYRLHVKAWQQHFADIFGVEALKRVRGFPPSEMALPNHPDVAYEFVKTLKECGFWWVLVQEHTVEDVDTGSSPRRPHIPHRLLCRNSDGDEISILALIKTQGSDTKLVAQMQPWFEAQSLARMSLNGRDIPPIVTQIADGENGGVMMNEFPSKYMEVVRNSSHGDTPLMNGTEYLEMLFASGVSESELPVIQPIKQKQLFERYNFGDGQEKLKDVIQEIKKGDHRFHMEGGSWTNNISWVNGYEKLLGPMEELSSLFNEKILKSKVPTSSESFRKSLYYLLLSQTSCFRYWGEGVWADYGREITKRGKEILSQM